MRQVVNEQIKTRVIKEWLSGNTGDEISAHNGIDWTNYSIPNWNRPALSISYCSVSEKAEMQNVSTEAASYRVIENIGEYNKLVEMKKQLVNTAMQISMMEIIYACQKNSIRAPWQAAKSWVL